MFKIKKILYNNIANIITSLNLFSGLLSIYFAINNNLNQALFFLILAILLDTFDGFIARKLNLETKFGKEFDSFSDLVSFAISPFIFLLQFSGNINLIPGIIYVLMAIIRLSKYNVKTFSGVYIGLPVTICPIIFIIAFYTINFLMPFILLILSFLMISNIKINKPKILYK